MRPVHRAKTVKKLFIVGAGGFGREVLSWARDCESWGTEWNFCGFLDDDQNALEGLLDDNAVADTIESYQPSDDHLLIIGLADPRTKKRVIEELSERGALFTSMIHPSVIIGQQVRLGKGAVLCPHSVITCDVNIGDYLSMNLHTSIGHDARVGDYCHMNSYSEITGRCTIGNGVLFGSHAFILPGKKVGDLATVGAGSVVVRSVLEGRTVFGNPARAL